MVLETIGAALAFGLVAIGAVVLAVVIGLLECVTNDKRKEVRSRWLP